MITTDLMGAVVQSRFSSVLFRVRGVYLNPPEQVKRVVLICAEIGKPDAVNVSLQEFGLGDVKLVDERAFPKE